MIAPQYSIVEAQINAADHLTVEIDIPPNNAQVDTAYLIPMEGCWDGLGTVPIVDEAYETDSTDFRSALGKIQYGPRILNIIGKIYVPNPSTPKNAYNARRKLLRDIYGVLGRSKNLTLTIKVDKPGIINPENYVLHCHLHGPEAVKVVTAPLHYTISISLIAEDPLIYLAKPSDETEVKYTGDVPEYIELVIRKCKGFHTLFANYNDDPIPHPIWTLHSPVGTEQDPVDITITVEHPGQICKITGTQLSNIDITLSKDLFPRLYPSDWVTLSRNDRKSTDEQDIDVWSWHPRIGIPP